MVHALRDRDMSALLDVIEAGRRGGAAPGHLAPEVLLTLCRVIDCDAVTFLEMDVAQGIEYVSDACFRGGDELVDETLEPVGPPDGALWLHYPTTAPSSCSTDSGDDRSVTLITDFLTPGQWRRSPMYVDALEVYGTDYGMTCPFPCVDSWARRVVFIRRGGPDFTERERAMLTILRPHFIEMLERSMHAPALISLTSRQVELLRLVAVGYDNAEVASVLCISRHTVRKHLENIYDRLGVTSRTAAVAAVFPAAERPRAVDHGHRETVGGRG